MKITSFFLSFCLMGLPCWGWADFYQIQEIDVQSSAASAKEAKNDALEQAQRQAFVALMRRLVGEENPFVDQLPETSEIVSLVQDLSLKNEKNTKTDYWADVDVQFKKQAVEEFLISRKVPFLKTAPASLLVIPVLKTANGFVGIEEGNPLNQFLTHTKRLSDFYELKLLNGDLEEIVAVNQSLKTTDRTPLNALAMAYQAEALLFVTAEQVGSDNWRLTGEIYAQNTLQQQQVAFDWYQGYSIESAWAELMKKLEAEVREKQALLPETNKTYYARLNETSLAQWVQDKKRLEKLKFLKDVLLQGSFKDQMLISFSYEREKSELQEQWQKAGWVWSPDFMGNSGTLTKGVLYE